MPLYEYACTTCKDKFERLASMSESTDTATCPDCGGRGLRALSAFASFSRGIEGGMQPVAAGGGGMCACGGSGA